jgi:hypothetical protein
LGSIAKEGSMSYSHGLEILGSIIAGNFTGRWQDLHTYDAGDSVSYNNAYWIALVDTASRPGDSGDWMIAAKDDVMGVDYTDAFFAAKKSVDDILTKADSSVNMVQHAAIVPYQTAEAAIIEGFRQGIDQKDKTLVDSATAAMNQLASSARKFFIDPSTGAVKSQTKEAATKFLVDTGGGVQKFQEKAEDALSWLKWAAIIGGSVLVLGGIGVYIVPIMITRRAIKHE